MRLPWHPKPITEFDLELEKEKMRVEMEVLGHLAVVTLDGSVWDTREWRQMLPGLRKQVQRRMQS